MELIALIILFLGFLGISIIVIKKSETLAELPQISQQFNLKEVVSGLKGKIETSNPFKGFSTDLFLQKVLSKIRVLTLKTENKTSSWLQKLREKTKNRKNKEGDNYWQAIRKSEDDE